MTHQEIIKQLSEAFDRAVEICGREFVAKSLLERFGAGGGEPFGYFCDWGDHDGLQRIAMYYGEPGSATFDDWNEYPKVHKNLPLYTHPSTTDLQDAYYQGFMASGEGWNGEYPFQDGSKDPRLDGRWCQTRDNAIEALKGKQ